MLTRSPVLATSSNPSPTSFHGFHYAPAPSPHQSPTRVSTALSRRLSQSSLGGPLAQPSHQRPKPYIGVDAATQYSPMETLSDMAAGRVAPSQDTTAIPEPPPPPRPKPMVYPEVPVQTPSHRAADQGSSSSAQHVVSVADVGQSQPQSPNKRRNSQGPGAAGEAGAVAASASSSPKRPRPATAPPKVLPQRYELCPVEDMVVLISNMLGELIETNDALALKSGHLTRFHSRTAPGISVLDYLHRLAKHATLTPPLLLSMVYYIDRLCALYPDFTINTLTVHRFLITAATVAAKGLSDSFWNNSTYARVGGVKVAELKLLELEFLYRVDWKIVPNPEVLVSYYRGLVERCPGYVLEGEQTPSDGHADAMEDGNGENEHVRDVVKEEDDSSDDSSDEEQAGASPTAGSDGAGNG